MEGQVDISWSDQSRGKHWLILRWVEHAGPPVVPPSRVGFGRLLLERSLAYDGDGEVDLAFRQRASQDDPSFDLPTEWPEQVLPDAPRPWGTREKRGVVSLRRDGLQRA